MTFGSFQLNWNSFRIFSFFFFALNCDFVDFILHRSCFIFVCTYLQKKKQDTFNWLDFIMIIYLIFKLLQKHLLNSILYVLVYNTKNAKLNIISFRTDLLDFFNVLMLFCLKCQTNFFFDIMLIDIVLSLKLHNFI